MHDANPNPHEFPGPVTVRPSTLADAEGIRKCLDVVARERRHIAMVEAPTLRQVREFLGSMAARGVIQFVAMAGSEVAGWCDLTRMALEGFRHCATLGMGLRPAYRGHGLAAELLRTLVREAPATGIAHIELEVYTANRSAISLYERFGFSREGIKRSARMLDGRVEDILFMALLLPPLAEDRAGDRSDRS